MICRSSGRFPGIVRRYTMQRDPTKAVEVYVEHQTDRLDWMVRQVRALTWMVGANITLTLLVLGKLLVA